MVFSGATFLLAFLPVVFLLHQLSRDIRIKNIILLIASLVFYGVGEPVYVFLMLFSICANYAFGRFAAGKRKKLWLVFSVIFNLALLGVFKYTDFILSLINGATGLNIPMTGIALPIGISFFTFQAMSYVIDVYREPSLSQKNIFRLALYISFFPQLIAGPIVRYGDISRELEQRTASADDIAEGLRRFVFGLSKKLIAANSMGRVADAIFGISGGGSYIAWFGAICYCLQIYYDFSGYSDMAIGLGRAFGFHFLENFDYPYAASSLKDFWRRWHISLSSWFKSYLYIPLGGNRRGEARTELNKLIVFFLTGLWHGAGLNFIIWGLIHGVCSCIENIVSKRVKLPAAVSRVYALLVVLFAFVFFRADTPHDAAMYISAMFGGCKMLDVQIFLSLLTPKTIVIFVLGIVFAMPLRRRLDLRRPCWERASYAAAALLFVLCVMTAAQAGYDPFIYFRF